MMGNPVPTLGYPTRQAAVVALRNVGMGNKEIASKLGISTSTVASLYSTARNKRPANPLQRTVRVDKDVLDALKPAAETRGIRVNELCRRLLAACVDDDLTDAILDDSEQTPKNKEATP